MSCKNRKTIKYYDKAAWQGQTAAVRSGNKHICALTWQRKKTMSFKVLVK